MGKLGVLIFSVFLCFILSGCFEQAQPVKGQEIEVSSSTFASTVLGAQQPVLVDFYADWCGPCKKMAPVVAEISNEYSGRVVVAKVDVDESGLLAQKYEIRGIPTFLFFEGGKPVYREVGPMSKGEIRKKLDSLLK